MWAGVFTECERGSGGGGALCKASIDGQSIILIHVSLASFLVWEV